jgi:hypothetical protein
MYFGVDDRRGSKSTSSSLGHKGLAARLVRDSPVFRTGLCILRLVPSGTRQPLGRAKGYENTSLPLGSRLALIPTYHPASVIGFNPKRGEERTTELGL